ncbi:MAG: AAA family ATPase, partial [Firmicutes bacterium]|nr:AAA family ATPase [Bacillota bacterium]
MYLKRIELYGFKSFSSKGKIEFEPGISCIVGPNGSGKSNIADAVRWVLGESNARSIRGNRMEDVIFSGTASRRPLGAAEVTVVLDNADSYLPLPFSEVSVTRRAIRGGGSEYYINEAPCRLRDIHDLFVDTGVGLEGLSLINQGRINELVSARPEERRALVEEAAGIVKYRDRKAEASRKLAETERHLERVGDIIGELETRVEPLKEQAERAQQFLDLQHQADDLEIGVSVKVLTEANDKIAELDAGLKEREEGLLAAESKRLTIAAEAEQLRLNVAAKGEAVAAVNEEYYGLQTRREHEEGELKLARERLENNEEQSRRITAELEAGEEAAKAREAELASLAEQISALEAELARQEELIAGGEGGSQDLADYLARLEEEASGLRDELNRIGSELAKAEQSGSL